MTNLIEKQITKYIKEKEIDLTLHDAESLALLKKVIRLRIEAQAENAKIFNFMNKKEKK